MENEQVRAIRKRHIIFAINEKDKSGLKNMVGVFSCIVNGEELETAASVGRLVKDEDMWRFYPNPKFTYQSDTLRFLDTGKLKITEKGFESDLISEDKEDGLSI